MRGDADADGTIGIADALRILDYLFRKGEPFDCESAADVDDDGELDLGDAVHTLLHLFRGGPLPPPNRLCDFDPTRDGLGCESFAKCF